VGGAFRVIVASPASNTLYFRHGDHLGSTSVLSDSSGAKVSGSEVVYAPFGEVRVGALPTLTDLGFTGQHFDRSTGPNQSDSLMHYGARYYLPGLRRFISADSLIPGRGSQPLNRYSYTLNNPVRYSDPTGYFVCEVNNSTQADYCADLQDSYDSLMAQLGEYGVTVSFEGLDDELLAYGVGVLQNALNAVSTLANAAYETILTLVNVQPGYSEQDAFKQVFKATHLTFVPDGDLAGYAVNNGFSDGAYQIKIEFPKAINDGLQTGEYLIAHEIGHNITWQVGDYSSRKISGTDIDVRQAIYIQAGNHGTDDQPDCTYLCELAADVVATWGYNSYLPPGTQLLGGQTLTQEHIDAARNDIDTWMSDSIKEILGL